MLETQSITQIQKIGVKHNWKQKKTDIMFPKEKDMEVETCQKIKW